MITTNLRLYLPEVKRSLTKCYNKKRFLAWSKKEI